MSREQDSEAGRVPSLPFALSSPPQNTLKSKCYGFDLNTKDLIFIKKVKNLTSKTFKFNIQ